MVDFQTLQYQKEAISPPSRQNEELAKISRPHINSFNSLFDQKLLIKAVQNIGHQQIIGPSKLEFWLSEPSISKPFADGKLTMPAECRERGISYKAPFQVKLNWKVDNILHQEVKSLGSIPVMVKSERCNLDGKTPLQLIQAHEEPQELGGYFISNGIDRLIRLLIVPRRNHPTALIRPSFQKRGPTYSSFGVQIRSVRDDQTSQTITLHYCTDGQVTLRFSYRKAEYMVPVMLILKALVETTDQDIFERVTMGDDSDTFVTDRVEMMLESFKRYLIHDRKSSLAYLGSKFGVMLDAPDDAFEHQVGADFLRQIILVHLKSNQAKFDLIIFMIQKLYGLVSGKYGADNPDSLQFQEVLLPGHLYLSIIKEKMADWLGAIKLQIQTDLRRQKHIVDFKDKKYLAKVVSRTTGASDIGKKLEYFLATGNLISNTGLDLQQVSGYTIIAEKLNFYRYTAHFQSIHRGAFFAELKTTTVRKLLPESYGFLCPVHTPDGSPCGLLNHLSHTCEIATSSLDVSKIPSLVSSLGAHQIGSKGARIASSDPQNLDSQILTIQLDGEPIGWCTAAKARTIAATLRDWKVKGLHGVPLALELGLVPPSNGGQYPGLFIFSTAARMMRPCKYLATGTKDMIGPFEQVYMNIACLNEDYIPGLTTHQDFEPTDMLSVIASLTPFSDFNQSPRNMYQCQMGKQSMGTPAQNLYHRTDNKLYRLQTGQTPIVRPEAHEKLGMDGYPNGMNAVVCVISYTGYDMEDASILAKSSFERGYGYGTVYKGEWIDIGQHRISGEPIVHHFGFRTSTDDPSTFRIPEEQLKSVINTVDLDGLPQVGARIKQGDAFYAFCNDITQKVKIVRYKGLEDAYIDQVRLVGDGDSPLQKIHVKLRIPRPPIIGDKFSSRHGQKGVISQKWPSVDMPFSETGIIPDVIINPHAFPSRMTIGMFVESIAAKAGALHGHAQDATPFRYSEDDTPQEYFGEQLLAAGFNYHGNEAMYSGITGQEFKADIYIGVLDLVVYYQRLRHMVSDKFQVRTTGPIDTLTHQPVKGRKRAGGIRFGEMERDSLLAHGASFLLQDRLMNCSDYSKAHLCVTCGTILSPFSSPNGISCAGCDGKNIKVVAIPYVFKYLCAELVAMNVKLRLSISD